MTTKLHSPAYHLFPRHIETDDRLDLEVVKHSGDKRTGPGPHQIVADRTTKAEWFIFGADCGQDCYCDAICIPAHPALAPWFLYALLDLSLGRDRLHLQFPHLVSMVHSELRLNPLGSFEEMDSYFWDGSLNKGMLTDYLDNASLYWQKHAHNCVEPVKVAIAKTVVEAIGLA